MAPEEEVVRAGQAAQVLDSPIFQEAKQRILEGLQTQMRAVSITDEKMHTRLILTLQLWGTLEGYLNSVRETGRLAQFQIDQRDERKRFRMFG